jgi:hypothetical protein|nr:MAG TPA: hypothetical protein [Caudoviricetes sp.]
MTKKVKTTKISGGTEYAKVADRLKEFREKCPRGKITNSFQKLDNGDFIFRAEIVTDLKNDSSPRADATSMMSASKMKNDKGFEKGQTVAVGRALAFLGYLASGEIASSEEMEEYENFKAERFEEQVGEALEKIGVSKNIQDLQKAWLSLSQEVKADPRVRELKDDLKFSLSKGMLK